jgi:hypothetical protein
MARIGEAALGTVPCRSVTYFVTGAGEGQVEESTIAAASITALPVHLHHIGRAGSAGAMPFGEFVASCGQ